MKKTILLALLMLLMAAAATGLVAVGRERVDAPEEIAQAESYDGNVDYDGRVLFVRLRFDVGFGPNAWRMRGSRGELPWAHDYPTADIHLMKILKELSLASPRTDASNVLKLDDPGIFDYPILYMSEPGYWTMSDAEVKGLRDYLLKGGFIIFDDFRGDDMFNVEEQMKRALPDHRWFEIGRAHQVFNSFFEIKNFDFGEYGKETYFGIFEGNDPTKRLMAIAGHNQDLGEYWEYSDTGLRMVDLTNEAYKYGVNYFIYGLTH